MIKELTASTLVARHHERRADPFLDDRLLSISLVLPSRLRLNTEAARTRYVTPRHLIFPDSQYYSGIHCCVHPLVCASAEIVGTLYRLATTMWRARLLDLGNRPWVFSLVED